MCRCYYCCYFFAGHAAAEQRKGRQGCGLLALHPKGQYSYLLGGHAAAEERGGGEVPPVARVGRAHHVLGVPHLLRQLRHRQRAVLLAPAARQRREADHEEVQAREGDQVHRQLAQVRVQLPCAGRLKAGQSAGLFSSVTFITTMAELSMC